MKTTVKKINQMLNKNSKFGEIEKWFKNNVDDLPETLDVECRFYSDLKSTINIYISQVYSEVKRVGIDDVKNKKSKIANSAKRNLYIIYEDLKNLDGWNIKQKDVKAFANWSHNEV